MKLFLPCSDRMLSYPVSTFLSIILLILFSQQLYASLPKFDNEIIDGNFSAKERSLLSATDIEVYYESDAVQITESTGGNPNIATVSYTLFVTNNGPDEATNLQVAINYHDEVIPYNRIFSSGSWAGYFWEIPNLASGETVEFTESSNIMVPYNNKWVQASLLAMDQDDPDSTPGNWVFTEDDSDKLEIYSPECDLDLTLAVNNTEYDQYNHVYYEVVVQNFGPSIATDVSASIPLPPGMVVSSQTSATQGSYSSYNEIWEIGSLAIGQTVLLNLALFTLDTDGPKTVFAQVQTTAQPDPDSTPGNDTDQTPDEDDEALVTIYPEGYSNCSGTLVLSSQAEVDAFGPCTIFDGNILITGNSVTDFSAFDGLEEITGTLTFADIDNLFQLTGFNQLHTIGGSLNITSNSDLNSINAFSGLESVGDELSFFTNPDLIDIQGFDNLQSAHTLLIENSIELINIDAFSNLSSLQRIEFSFNPSLQNVDGLSNIPSSVEFIKLLELYSLENINGLSQITTVSSHYLIRENTVLESLDPLSNLTSVGGNLSIELNHLVTNLDALSNLETVGDELFINYNGGLLNLDGLTNLQSVGSGLLLKDNPSLSDCCGLYPLLSSNGVSGIINISNNPSACSSESEILSTCAPTSCSGNIVLTTQTEVDAFGPCTVFDGTIEIGGDDITDLSAFDGLQEITGRLQITTDNLTSLDAFHQLETVGDNLVIAGNAALVSMNAFSNLESVEKSLVISNNGELVDIQGFDILQSVEDLIIQYNIKITNIDAFSSLNSVQDLLIEFNPLLENVDGLSNINSTLTSIRLIEDYGLQNINGLSHITEVTEVFIIAECVVLQSFDPLSNLTSVGSSLIISLNNLIENLDGLSNLETIGGNLTLSNNAALSDCCGLYPLLSSNGVSGTINISNNPLACSSESEILTTCAPTTCTGNITLNTQAEVDAFDCSEITGNLYIGNTPASDIFDLSPLSTLTSVGGFLFIENNPNLTSLQGLHSLNSIGSSLIIENNDALVNIEALNSVNSLGGSLDIRNNAALPNVNGFLMNTIPLQP